MVIFHVLVGLYWKKEETGINVLFIRTIIWKKLNKGNLEIFCAFWAKSSRNEYQSVRNWVFVVLNMLNKIKTKKNENKAENITKTRRINWLRFCVQKKISARVCAKVHARMHNYRRQKIAAGPSLHRKKPRTVIVGISPNKLHIWNQLIKTNKMNT